MRSREASTCRAPLILVVALPVLFKRSARPFHFGPREFRQPQQVREFSFAGLAAMMRFRYELAREQGVLVRCD